MEYADAKYSFLGKCPSSYSFAAISTRIVHQRSIHCHCRFINCMGPIFDRQLVDFRTTMARIVHPGLPQLLVGEDRFRSDAGQSAEDYY